MTTCACETGAYLEGFSVYSLLHWASCFKSISHTHFLSSHTFVSMKYVFRRRYFTLHQCIPHKETIQISLGELYLLPGSFMATIYRTKPFVWLLHKVELFHAPCKCNVNLIRTVNCRMYCLSHGTAELSPLLKSSEHHLVHKRTET